MELSKEALVAEIGVLRAYVRELGEENAALRATTKAEKQQCETCANWVCLIKGTGLKPNEQPTELYYGKCRRFSIAITHWVMTCHNYALRAGKEK